jgi:SynChlorMet cassette protein ScmC
MITDYLAKTAVSGAYLLLLGNGQGWQFIPNPEVMLEVGELGRIMGLRPCEPNGYPKLIFSRMGPVQTECEDATWRFDQNIKVNLRRLGWKAHELTFLRFWSHDEVPDLICEMRHEEGDYQRRILSMRFSLYPIYQQVQDSGGLPLHAGLVEHNGKGVLLAGPKNAGKSTCCRRLPKPWYPLCDEETLIVKVNQEQYLAHPFPTWSDYLSKRSEQTWSVHNHVPISSIFFLEQAGSDEVIPLGRGEAAVFINQLATQISCRYWNNLDHEDLMSRKTKLFENATELAKAVPAFRLQVSLEGRFWEEMEKVLN